MKRRTGLRRAMILMVAAPLIGAIILAANQVRQLTTKGAELNRMVDVIAIAVDVTRFNILMGLEYSDSWNMFIDAATVNVYRQHIDECEALVARIREKLKRIDPAAYNKNFTANIEKALTIYEEIPAIRTYYLARRPGDDREARTLNNRAYTDMAGPLGAVIRSLVSESNELPIRLRIQTLIWCADLHNNATTESGMYCWGHELGSFRTLENCASPEFSTQMRRSIQKQLLANSVPELRPYFEKIFNDPVYLEADRMVRKFTQEDTPGKKHFAPADLPAWRELTEKKRYPLLVQLQPYVLDELQVFATDYARRVHQERVLTISLLSAVLLVSAAVALFMSRSLLKTVAAAVVTLKQGMQNMLQVVRQTDEAAASLAEAVSGQAASLEETAASLEELTATNRQNAESARAVTGWMKQNDAYVHRATESLNQLVQAVNRIATTSEQTKHIAHTIDEIAYQTNLLALNASVEAARAGDAGACFAVIAEEVRQMATRASAESASIDRLIGEAHSLTGEGVGLSQQVNAGFQQVEVEARAASARMTEVHTKTQELLAGIDEINAAARNLDQQTQHSAAIAEENAATANFIDQKTVELSGNIALLESLITRQTGKKEPAPLAAGQPANTPPAGATTPRQLGPTAATRHLTLQKTS